MAYQRIDQYDETTTAQLAEHYRAILNLLGEDADREGLLKTPARVAKAMQFITQGYAHEGDEFIKSALFQEEYNEMLLVKDVEFYSTCEHHLMPFFGKCHVAYIPDGTITGLSKIVRVIECYARRLQVQERLTDQIAACIDRSLHPKGVAVWMEAKHTCMSMRGVQKETDVVITSSFTGVFKTDASLRQEFLLRVK